jgi:hypothetical protein
MTNTHEYAFDVNLNGAIRVMADSEAAAREFLDKYLDSAEVYMGEGEPVYLKGEVSLATEPNEAQLFQVDGEDVEPLATKRKPTYAELVEMLSENLNAWDEEEGSVKREHAKMIEQTASLLARVPHGQEEPT